MHISDHNWGIYEWFQAYGTIGFSRVHLYQIYRQKLHFLPLISRMIKKKSIYFIKRACIPLETCSAIDQVHFQLLVSPSFAFRFLTTCSQIAFGSNWSILSCSLMIIINSLLSHRTTPRFTGNTYESFSIALQWELPHFGPQLRMLLELTQTHLGTSSTPLRLQWLVWSSTCQTRLGSVFCFLSCRLFSYMWLYKGEKGNTG